MSTLAGTHRTQIAARGGGWFAAAMLSVAVLACLLAGFAPLGFSIVTVYLFAGPHNWMEARFFVTRMPARWGPLRAYFLTGIFGVLLLTGVFAAIPWLANQYAWSDETFTTSIAVWNTVLVSWIVGLALMRSRQNPRRQWGWLVPAGLTAISLAWLWPQPWDLSLVYLHPLVALWFLDRELARNRPEWRRVYHFCLVGVAALLGVLWWRLADAPSLAGEDGLTMRITQHAGAGILQGVSSHLLVATHTFLEMLHYGVWLVAIPLVSLRSVPWKMDDVPLFRRSAWWRVAILSLLVLGAVMVLSLWAGFLADYPLMRDVYFTVAMLHVLAEVPFLLRSL